MRQYKLRKERLGHPAGTVVYLYDGYDYGLVRDDQVVTGVEHAAVTESTEQGVPFFTVPVRDLEPFDEAE